MKLKSFRIQNFKSIKDTSCVISDNDNILTLAGQNESGKSSILQALKAFSADKDYFKSDYLRMSESGEDTKIQIDCTFSITKEDLNAFKQKFVPDWILTILTEVECVRLTRTVALEDTTEWKISDTLLDTWANNPFLSSFEPELWSLITKSVSGDKITAAICEKEFAPGVFSEWSNMLESGGEFYDEENLFDYVSLMFDSQLLKIFRERMPKIIFFDDFASVLPSRIEIAALSNFYQNLKTNGLQAVLNVEKIVGYSLYDLRSKKDQQRKRQISEINERLTLDFNERWQQRVFEGSELNIELDYNQGEGNGAYLNFFIRSREHEYLKPEQRSQGFKWFLSFFLQLKADSAVSDEPLLILFDEPGLYLHTKAQKDIRRLFEELAAEGHQIIFSTHSPYLIDSDKLNQIRLVFNDEKNGTIVEKITTNVGGSKKMDALQPIIDAMGLEVKNTFTPVCGKNVLLEGISDLYYFTALKKLLGHEAKDYKFIPSAGVTNIHLLVSLCIGWGLEWCVCVDNDKAGKDAVKAMEKNFGIDALQEKINYLPEDCIEKMFAIEDLQLISDDIKQKLKSHADISNCGGKELLGRLFLEQVKNGHITADKLSKSCKDNFTKVFEFIHSHFH